MEYDEETLKKLSEAYEEALKAPKSKIMGALYGKAPFVTEEEEKLKRCKTILSKPHGIVKRLIKMTEPYEGVASECAKTLLSGIQSELIGLNVTAVEVDGGDFIGLTKQLLVDVERAIFVHPSGALDRLLSRTSALLCIYLNN